VKVTSLSTAETLQEDFITAKQQGYVTFIYCSADPKKTLASNKFLYVRSPEELSEKIALLEADKLVVDEVMRF